MVINFYCCCCFFLLPLLLPQQLCCSKCCYCCCWQPSEGIRELFKHVSTSLICKFNLSTSVCSLCARTVALQQQQQQKREEFTKILAATTAKNMHKQTAAKESCVFFEYIFFNPSLTAFCANRATLLATLLIHFTALNSQLTQLSKTAGEN